MFTGYEPRLCAFLGVRGVCGYRLKSYSIVQKNTPFEIDRFERCANLISSSPPFLPQPPVTPLRPGVGFMIFHQGTTGDYTIVSWWDNENELPTRIFVRENQHWRSAAGGESFCVWDIKVMWHERESYVQTVLAGAAIEQYMAKTLSGDV